MTDQPIYSDLLADDPDMAPIVAEFVTDLRAACDELKSALAAGDAPTVRLIAHTWRGAAGGHGFDSLTAVAGELEAAVVATGAVDDHVRAAGERFFAVADRVRPGRPE